MATDLKAGDGALGWPAPPAPRGGRLGWPGDLGA
jgi:hypothetical protein